MNIDSTVILAGIAVWGFVQITGTILATVYMGKFMEMMNKFTDVVVKVYEKTLGD